MFFDFLGMLLVSYQRSSYILHVWPITPDKGPSNPINTSHMYILKPGSQAPSQAHPTKPSWAHNWNLTRNPFVPNSYFHYPIRSQICTWHDSWAVVPCANLWYDLIITSQIKTKYIITRLGLGAHKLLVKRTPGPELQATPLERVHQLIGTGFIVEIHSSFSPLKCSISWPFE